jgi:hypothetical protein
LHPLPIPEKHGDSITLDFIGPLPTDHGFDYILSIMDRLNSDVQIVPTRIDLTTPELAVLFF